MKTNSSLTVKYHGRKVGTLAMTRDRKAAFSYDSDWIRNGFSISPFSLPLRDTVFVPTKPYFGGLYGVFSDSLPDAWGRLLVDRILRREGISQDQVSMLDRLAIVGSSGMGALTYEPEITLTREEADIDLNRMAESCRKLLKSETCDDLDQLYRLGGSSGGARPKITIQQDGRYWLVKFPAHTDSNKIGLMEYEYSCCARECGIRMPETRLFPSSDKPGYFGIERFDYDGTERKHMLTAAAMLEADFTSPCLDYHSLMKLTKIVTGNSKAQVEQMYRRMCFNVYAHNRDDHAKNFTYIYDEQLDRFSLSPAYDLTYSTTYWGEHTTSVNGNGKDPSEEDLIQVGIASGMTAQRCRKINDQIRSLVHEHLSEWLNGI